MGENSGTDPLISGTGNVQSMDAGKLRVVKNEMDHMNIDILGITTSSRPALSSYVAIALGLLTTILVSLLLYQWSLCHGNSYSACATCSSCPNHWLSYDKYFYYFSLDKKDWNASQEFCLSENSQLLMIKDVKELERLKNLLCFNLHWLGLRKNSHWRWEDGTILNVSRILSNSVIQKCGALNKHGLQASSCEVPLQWICRKSRL
ncbi:PREDICTED: killer cell lectin-like receptor subfamily G member 1 [Elephantulus edwardii]|uniref:killer cell lectin-like receptor subfamily G member 1 n=1 Tax=Elephantulus edwardii TaxID=28737 RepID=UPI0003F0C029|nr:PREDICTED: killer cell lectin-like receptor subfamily G member 1 [Elephantulus edwardii]